MSCPPKLLQLPDEMLLLILQQLDYSTVQLSVRSVNQRLYCIASDTSLQHLFRIPEYCPRSQLIRTLATHSFSTQLRALYLRVDDDLCGLVTSLFESGCVLQQLQFLEAAELVAVTTEWLQVFPRLTRLHVTQNAIFREGEEKMVELFSLLAIFFPNLKLQCTIIMLSEDPTTLKKLCKLQLNWKGSTLEIHKTLVRNRSECITMILPLTDALEHYTPPEEQDDLHQSAPVFATDVHLCGEQVQIPPSPNTFPGSLRSLTVIYPVSDFPLATSVCKMLTHCLCPITSLSLRRAALPSSLLPRLPVCLLSLSLTDCTYKGVQRLETSRSNYIPRGNGLDLLSLTAVNNDAQLLCDVIDILPTQVRLSKLRIGIDESCLETEDIQKIRELLDRCECLQKLLLKGDFNSLFTSDFVLPSLLSSVTLEVFTEKVSRSNESAMRIVRSLRGIRLLEEVRLEFKYIRPRFGSAKVNWIEIENVLRDVTDSCSGSLRKLSVACVVVVGGDGQPLKAELIEKILVDFSSLLGASKIKGDSIHFAPKAVRQHQAEDA